eukprot:s1995_g17.t1
MYSGDGCRRCRINDAFGKIDPMRYQVGYPYRELERPSVFEPPASSTSQVVFKAWQRPRAAVVPKSAPFSMASMLSGAMAAVGQARTDATAALERGVERAKAAATDAVEHARGSVVSLSTTAPTPCAVCGRPTRSGDGGACGDVGDMAGKEPKEGPRRCYSCLTAAETEQVDATRKQQQETLDSFFAGEPPPVHVDPEESALEKAHRLGSLALGGAVDLMGWIPGVGSITKGTIQVLHKVVKFGPLALYSAELVETLQLLVVMANRTGAAKIDPCQGSKLQLSQHRNWISPKEHLAMATHALIDASIDSFWAAAGVPCPAPNGGRKKKSALPKLPQGQGYSQGAKAAVKPKLNEAIGQEFKKVVVETSGREGYNSAALNGLWHFWKVKNGRLAFDREIQLREEAFPEVLSQYQLAAFFEDMTVLDMAMTPNMLVMALRRTPPRGGRGGPSFALARYFSREREVKVACDALAESIQTGDSAWFERVIQQLRGVLLERQNDAAVAAVEASARPPVSKAAPVVPPKPAAVSTFPTARPEVTPVQSASNFDEAPPWLQALRLLEEAARPMPRRDARTVEASAAKTERERAEGYFPATAPAPEELQDQQLQAYLQSFSPDPPPAVEPGWAKAIRLLEAAPVSRRSSEPVEPRAKEAVKAAAQPEIAPDRQRHVRMQSYQALLQQSATAQPGAALPAWRPKRREEPEKVETVKEVVVKPQVLKSKAAEDVGIGRGHLVPSQPGPLHDDEETDVVDGELRKEDLVWSEHEFNDGDRENRRVLRKFTKEFKKMAEDIPEGIRNPKLLTAALDLALACVKCYELDKADAIYRRVLGECRRRGMPWDVKCLQDLATLRCKQHRQADAAELLEELAQKAPPHPATFINLGTVYNQLRQYEKAESWFHQAVNLKGGTPEREDVWNLAICKKNMGRYDEALPMLQQALAEFQLHEPHHPVTIAKLHSSLGGCLHDMGRFSEAAEHYGEAGGKLQEAFEALEEAFGVHARCDSVHPTPLFECLEMALKLHDECPTVDLSSLKPIIEDGLKNLESRGQHEDGNAGLVMSRAGKLLLRCGDHNGLAVSLLRDGQRLIREAHEAKEADLAHEILEVDLLLQQSDSTSGPSSPAASAML